MKKTLLITALLTTAVAYQAQSYCAYNKSSLTQRWYISPDVSGHKMLEFLKGLEGTEIAVAGLDLVKNVGVAIGKEIASEGAETAQNVASVVSSAATDVPEIATDSIIISKLKKMPGVGSYLHNPSGLIGNLGRLISMGILHVRWGKEIPPGGKACWNKDQVKKEFKLRSNTSPMYFLVIGYNKSNEKEATIALAGSYGIDRGIVASYSKVKPDKTSAKIASVASKIGAATKVVSGVAGKF